MKPDRISSISNQLAELYDINMSVIEELSPNLVAVQPKFDITFGLFDTISQIDPLLHSFFESINYLLCLYLKNTIFDMKWENCPYCQSTDIGHHGIHDKDMKDLTGIVPVNVQRYICKNCDGTFSLGDKELFNLSECQVSLPLSRLMVALYTGGLSLRYVADIINSTYNQSINHDTVREHVIKWGKKIRKDYRNDLTRRKVKTMQMDEKYVTIRCQDPQDSSVQIIIKLDSEKNKIIDLQVNNARQITDLDTRIAIERLDEPPKTLLTDGAKGIESAVGDYEECEHRKCLEHRVRNVRKRKYIKETIPRLSSEIVDQEKNWESTDYDKYREWLENELQKMLEEKKIVEKNKEIELWHADKLQDENMEEKFGEQARQSREAFHEAMLHRRLYCAYETAERMKHKIANDLTMEEALQLELTTGKLEGINRLMGTRERKALCFRTTGMVEALSWLLAEYYNYRRGHGSVETPFTGFNQIDVEQIGTRNRAITVRSKKYGQSFGIDVEKLMKNKMTYEIPNLN